MAKKLDLMAIPEGFSQEERGGAAKFGQKRIGGYKTNELLDGLFAMGVPLSFLKQLADLEVPQITSVLLRSGFSRSVLDRALRVVDSYGDTAAKEGDFNKTAAGRMITALKMRGVPISQFQNALNKIIADDEELEGSLRLSGRYPTRFAPEGLTTAHVAAAAAAIGIDDQVTSNAKFWAVKPKGEEAFQERQRESLPFTHGGATFVPTPSMNERLRGSRGQGVTQAQIQEERAEEEEAARLAREGEGEEDLGGPSDEATLQFPEPKLPKTDEEVINHIKKKYGGNAWFLDIPEVREILFNSARQGVPPEDIDELVQGTGWFKNTDDNARAWFAFERSDPASARADIAKQFNYIDKKARRLGISVDTARIQDLAETSMRYAWGDEEIDRALGAEFFYDPEDRKGGTTVNALKGLADEYFVPLSDRAIQTWGRDIISGVSTEEDMREWLKGQAQSLFPHLQAPLERGETVMKYMDQYYQSAADLLEVPRESIDFKDPKWMKPLTMVNEKGERSVMSLDQWQRVLRTDEKYGYSKTQQARNEAVALATDLAKTFGMRA